MNNKLLLITFRNTFIAAGYIFAVSQVLQYGQYWFGNNNILAPFTILLLFSLSAAIVGGLVFGQAILLFLDGKKRESIHSAIYSVAWLASYTVLTIILLVILK